MEAEGFKQLLKQLDAKYELLDKAHRHAPLKKSNAALNKHF